MNWHKREGPLLVSITGIDGSGKDTVTQQSLVDLSLERHLTAMKIGRPSYRIENGWLEQRYTNTTESFDRMHHFADMNDSRFLIMAANALNIIVQSRIIEAHSLKDRTIDILASSRDVRVDPVVYFDYYGNGAARHIGKALRTRMMQALTGVRRDLIILLEVSPELAVKRIERSIIKDRPADNGDPLRRKWRHPHENVSDLTILAEGYNEALNIISATQGTEIVRINTDGISKDEAATAAKEAIANALDNKRQR